MNRLAREQSPYLRHAAGQKVDWYPWSEEAFELARRLDKPVFLSTGAVWCHWCHVMAKESFSDERTARFMNERFINIKLDRDERPDVDRRYQQAVASMGGGSGWPLSVFLTPDKEPFYGGTYFPPEDRQGRPGFGRVLESVSAFYLSKKDDAQAFAERVMAALKAEPLAPGELSESLVTEAEQAVLAVFDAEHGGFGAAPKFPMPGALEFLLRRSGGGSTASGQAVRKTLEAMAAGGFHDQLGGGFHRYSTDRAWIVPHFEKMADDNAGLLTVYADAYAVFGERRFRDVARDILAFTGTVLSDPEGGFYASQDADVTPDDEGGYFTWSDDDFRNILNADEYTALSLHLLHDRSAMHHDPRKMVLFQSKSPEEVATLLGRTADEVRRVILRGREKLLRARGKRPAPFIDKTLYTSLNGMLIAAWLHAAGVLGDDEAKTFGLKSLRRILKERLVDGHLFHSGGIPAALDDYVNLIDALISACTITGEAIYLNQADGLMVTCLEKFYDKGRGGFFDTENEVLGVRMKRIEDVPHASSNAEAVLQLLKLALLTGKNEYRDAADRTLKIFGDLARELGVHAGAYFCALDVRFRMLQLTVEAAPESSLGRWVLNHARRSDVILYGGVDNSRVIPCINGVCYEPLRDAQSVANFIKNPPVS